MNRMLAQFDIHTQRCTELYEQTPCTTTFSAAATLNNQQALVTPPSADMEASVYEVEKILNYNFMNKRLLEEALTHSSYTDAASYQRLEFIGDAALGLAFSNHVFLAYPHLDPGQLSMLRAANISTEKLARVAIRHGFYRFVRHNAIALDDKVKKKIKY